MKCIDPTFTRISPNPIKVSAQYAQEHFADILSAIDTGEEVELTCPASVWDALEDTPALAENMKLRPSLMLALKEHIAKADLTQSEAGRRFGVTQPRISDLLRGEIDLFAIDTLVNMLATAGISIELRVGRAA